MIVQAYSLYDRKALRYHAPFFAVTDGEAIRSCSDLVQDTNTTVGRHPNDYVLYCVGSYRDDDGHLKAQEPLRHVVDLNALVPPVPNVLPFTKEA